MSRRRVFRRRSNGEWTWLKENAHLAVLFVACVLGLVGWAALFDGSSSQAEYATAELLAGSEPYDSSTVADDDATDAESSPADNVLPSAVTAPSTSVDATPATEAPAPPIVTRTPAPVPSAPPATALKPIEPPAVVEAAPAPVHAAPTAVSPAREAAPRRAAQRAARSARTRYAFIDRSAGKRRAAVRRSHARVRAREQVVALATPAPSPESSYDDELDRPYVPPATNERPHTRVAKIDPAWQEEIEHGMKEMECTRSTRAFGASRRVPTDC